MKNLRLLLVVLAVATVAGTVAAGVWLDVVWSMAVAVAGLVAVVLGTSFVQVRTLQTVSQRLARLRKQNEETAASVRALETTVRDQDGPTATVTLPPELRRALNDLTVASRSLTVPQVHFDQLLRTVSANTVRTERALKDAVDELRLPVPGGTPVLGATPGSGMASVGIDQQLASDSEQRHQPDEQRAQPAERELLEDLLGEVGRMSTLTDKTKQQLNRSVRRQVEMYGLLELLEGKFIGRLDQFVDEAQRELRRNRLQIAALSQQIDGQTSGPAPSGVSEFVVDGKFNVSRYLYYMSHQIPKEVEALQQLERTLDPVGFTPLLGGWALSPSGTLDIINVVERDRPEIVVECGSGSSTVWLALALRTFGGGHLFSLEHNPTFAESVRAQLAQQGLTEFATVLDAPIVENDTEDGAVKWYALDGLVDVEKIDLLVVDGPPQALGDLRGGALTLLRGRFVDGTHIFFDDVHRAEERDLVDTWCKQFTELEVQLSPTPVQAHLVWQIADGR